MSEMPIAINPAFLDASFLEEFCTRYRNTDPKGLINSGCRLLKIPFSCAIFEDFLHPNFLCADANQFDSVDELIDKVESEARNLTFQHRSNDMFTFNQSTDIANVVDVKASGYPLLCDIRLFLIETVLPWLEKLTGAVLEKNRVDFTSSMYKTNDVLLCHDDELDTRRIAFVWYLVPNDWDADREGGCLDLFSCHQEETLSTPAATTEPVPPVHPWKVSASIPPKRNMFLFFEPSAYSFHQVSEVIGPRDRLSLHGWFHGSPLPRPSTRHHPTPLPLLSPIGVEEDLVYRLINPLYLDMYHQSKIRRRFIKSSEIQLMNFLKVEEWRRVCSNLEQMDDSAWLRCGPFNRKNFEKLNHLESDDVPVTLNHLYRLFRSDAMLVILSDLTGIRLHPYSLLSTVPGKMENNAEPTDAKRLRLENGDICESELTSVHNNHVAKISEPQCRRWTLGSYTLLADSDVVDTSWRLECVLHLAGYGQRTGESRTPSWQSAWGGQLVYIAAGEIDELLTVIPTDNALTLVYTGPGTGSFVKYINHSARPLPLETQSTETRRSSVTAPCVYDFAITYHESDSVEPTAMSNALVDEEDDSSEESESVDDDDEDGEFSSANCTLE